MIYENQRADYVQVQYDVSVNNQWRRRNEWPSVFGTVGDGLSLAILILSIVPSAIFGALPFKLAFYYLIFANFLKYKNLNFGELMLWMKYMLNKEKMNVPGHRQSALFAIPLFLMIALNSGDAIAVEIVKAKKPVEKESSQLVIGDFFIDNVSPVTGHGDVDIKTLLDILVANRFDYKIIYDDTEIESMVVSWRSLPPRELTIDQILGSISVRYGVYFYTTRGSLEIHVAWLRDTAECKKRDGVYLRLCGTDAGKY